MIDRSTAPKPGRAIEFDFPPVERFALDCGLAVLVLPSSHTPLVSLRLLLPAGGDRSPTEAPGTAALAAAVLDEGTEARTSFELAAATEALGGFLASGADWDCARIDLEVFDRDVEFGLEILAEIAATATFPGSEVDRLRRQTVAHLRRRSMQPRTVARDTLNQALFGREAYGWPLLGTEHSLQGLGRESLVDFYWRHGTPRGSTLLVVGNIDTSRLERTTERIFARWSGRKQQPASLSPSSLPGARRILLVDRPGAAQTELCLGQVGISRADPDWLTASVMNTLLGGKFTSRLNLTLRERLSLTYGVSSFFSKRRGAGPFTVSAAIENEGVGRAIREILRALERLQQDRVPDEELTETIDYLVGIFPYTCETNAALTDRLRDLALYDLPLDHYRGLPAALRAVTPEEILACARRLLRPAETFVVAVGPADLLAAQVDSLGAVDRIAAP